MKRNSTVSSSQQESKNNTPHSSFLMSLFNARCEDAKITINAHNSGKLLDRFLKTVQDDSTTPDVLNLQGMGVGAKSMRVIHEQLTSRSWYTSLLLSKNQLDGEAVQHLARLLNGNRSIVKLDLRATKMSPTAMVTLSNSLKTSKVATLDLSSMAGFKANDLGILSFFIFFFATENETGY